MKQAIIEATENFFSTILCQSLVCGKSKGKNFYGAAVSLYENETEYIWYLFFKKDTLNEIAKNLLFEDNLCEDDLDDLLKEISNQIIGSAKVLLEEQNPHYKYQLSIPEFMGNISEPFPITFSESMLYKVKNRTFVVGNQVV